MFGSPYFRWLSGEWHALAAKTTDLPLSDADADDGTIPKGKLVDYKANDQTELAYIDGSALGILCDQINLYGVTGVQAFKDFTIGLHDLPKKRGLPVTIRVPHPGAEAEFEGLGASLYDNLVTTTGTGALASNSARNLELSVLKGCLYAAQEGDHVIALLQQANLTPYTVGNLRIRVRFVSPYLKPTLA